MTFDFGKFLTEKLHIPGSYVFPIVFCLAVLCIAGLIRLVFGKKSGLRNAVVSALGVIMLYCVCILIYTFRPAGLSRFLTPLPYVSFGKRELVVLSFSGAAFPVLCQQLLSMLMLTFLVNLINSFTPKKAGVLGWLALRLGYILAAIIAHYLLYWILYKLFGSQTGGVLQQYAPVILLSILGFMFLLGFLKFVVGIFLTIANPVLGGLYAFFFANKIGKSISRAIGSTAALTIFAVLLNRLGYSRLPIDAASLPRYIPFCLCVMLLWAILGR